MKKVSYYFIGIICLMMITGCSEEAKPIEKSVKKEGIQAEKQTVTTNEVSTGLNISDSIIGCETYEECLSKYKAVDGNNPEERVILEKNAKEAYKILQKIYSTSPTLSGNVTQSGLMLIVGDRVKEFAKNILTQDSLKLEEENNYTNTINFLSSEFTIKQYLAEAYAEVNTFREPTAEELLRIEDELNNTIKIDKETVSFSDLTDLEEDSKPVDIGMACYSNTIIDTGSGKRIKPHVSRCDIYMTKILQSISLNSNRIAINIGKWPSPVMFDMIKGDDGAWRLDFINPFNPLKKENPRIIMFRLKEKSLLQIWQNYKNAGIIK